MKLHKKEFEAVPGIKSYQLVNDKGLIVGVTSGFSSSENKEMAILFENSFEMFELLKECRNAFSTSATIDALAKLPGRSIICFLEF